MKRPYLSFASSRLNLSARDWQGLGLVLALYGNPASAFEFREGELSGSFDTTLSIGVASRVQSRDAALVGIANGGTSRSVNEDNGNLNYDQHDLYAAPLKATHELELKYHNLGGFFRASYFWDAVNHHKSELGDTGLARVGRDFEFLDAYLHGRFVLADKTLNVRLGNQVVSWGESTFIPNGINIINPVNLSKLRTPGAELREALLPTAMLWASQELSDTLSVEGFYQLNWKKTRIDPRGTYFSSNDFLSDDADRVHIGFGRRKDERSPLTSPVSPTAAIWAPRNPDNSPKDEGQYGVAARIFLPQLNNTEIGLFHINYHSRIPYATGIRGTVTSSFTGTPTGTAIGHTGTARYFAEYPENIRLWGVSFNTSAPGGVALQGEYSYRPNLPVQLSAPELLLAALGVVPNAIGTFSIGQTITGYRRVRAQQVQLTATKAFGPTLGADDLVAVAEVGYNHLDLPANMRFNGPGVYLPSLQTSANAFSFGSVQTDGFATRQSWGYRVLARMDFSSLIPSVTVSPRLAFSHDVNGTGPNFNEGVKAVTFGVGLNFKQNWQADLAYTGFFGGRTYSGTDNPALSSPSNPYPAGQPTGYASSANPLKDRDFVAASLTYSF